AGVRVEAADGVHRGAARRPPPFGGLRGHGGFCAVVHATPTAEVGPILPDAVTSVHSTQLDHTTNNALTRRRPPPTNGKAHGPWPVGLRDHHPIELHSL